MDMAITGLEISDRQSLIEDLHNLERALEAWDLVQEIKSIDTASIPVIKAKIDLREVRTLMKRLAAKEAKSEQASDKAAAEDPAAEEEEEGDQEPHWLPIDITFDDSQQPSQASGFEGTFGGSP